MLTVCFCIFYLQIRSDREYDRKIQYYLSGPGVDRSPLGIFSIDQSTGYVKIHAILDREEIATYNVSVVMNKGCVTIIIQIYSVNLSNMNRVKVLHPFLVANGHCKIHRWDDS